MSKRRKINTNKPSTTQRRTRGAQKNITRQTEQKTLLPSYTLNLIAMKKLCTWIVERHSIYRRRFLLGLPRPWTKDPVLLQWKYCNVFRELDSGSKYVLDELLPGMRRGVLVRDGDSSSSSSSREAGTSTYTKPYTTADVLLNLLVYRTFNKMDVFRALLSGLGGYLVCSHAAAAVDEVLDEVTGKKEQEETAAAAAAEEAMQKTLVVNAGVMYTPRQCEEILRAWLEENEDSGRGGGGGGGGGRRCLWTNAFVVSSFSFGIYRQNKERFHDKLSCVAHLISVWAAILLTLAPELDALAAASTTSSVVISEAVYKGFRSLPGIGPFNAYQVAVDVGYYRTDLFNENVFTVAGPGAKNGVSFKKIKHHIQFKNVKFSYPGSRADVLSDVSFRIPSGKLTGIIGASGSGKTTILDIMSGLRTINSGEIFFDKVPISALRVKSLRSEIALLTQEPFMFDDTVRNNLSYAQTNLSEKDLQNALRLSNSLDFINSLPQGLDTKIGDRGSNLSVGQKQRLAIARALLTNASIFLLDEPTSSLDQGSELVIVELIDMLIRERKTVVVVAHRMQTLSRAHHVIHLEGGKIINQGTFQNVVPLNSSF